MIRLSDGKVGKRILFLGYNRSQTRIIDAVLKRDVDVWHSNDRLTCHLAKDFDRIISFGYRYVLSPEIIATCPGTINLHIAYLPFNRGAHPNYWAFVDGTPHGVTIHLVDAGIDTGPILFQRRVTFTNLEATFAETHARLITEIESLFLEHLEEILFQSLNGVPQSGAGTYHRIADLPANFPGWNTNIADWLRILGRTAKLSDGRSGR